MKTIECSKTGSKIKFNLPTTLNEIDNDYLNVLTEHIKPANHYTLIGLVHHSKLSRLVMAYYTKKKSIETNVIPIFIKTGKTDVDFLNEAEIKDKLIIPNTEINLAHHVVVPFNQLSLDATLKTIVESTTKEEYEGITMASDDPEVYFVEFKLIGNSSIKGLYKKAQRPADKYVEIFKQC